MPTRRHFIGSIAAAAAFPASGWAEAGAPTHLSAARTPDGAYQLVGLRGNATIAFTLDLPGRGHAAAAHPHLAQAVAFARRPGTFAMVLDCIKGGLQHVMQAPPGRHFYGHGAFSRDGQFLLTTENEIMTGAGKIGIWRAGGSYRRLGEVSSNGIGPHEIISIPGTDHFAVANGGIRTHPDTGRDKLNLETMRPNLTILDAQGTVLDTAYLPAELHQNSLRHISAFEDGRIACAFQWQGDPYAAPSIVGVYTPGDGVALVEMEIDTLYHLDGYAGSVAALGSTQMAVTFPRGNRAQVIDLKTGSVSDLHRSDLCGVAGGQQHALMTDGIGGVHRVGTDDFSMLAQHKLAFDNHLIAIG